LAATWSLATKVISERDEPHYLNKYFINLNILTVYFVSKHQNYLLFVVKATVKTIFFYLLAVLK